MIETNDVYRKIKEMSKRTANPRPQIPVSEIVLEMLSPKEPVISSLKELKSLRLIQFDEANSTFVKLTLLGYTVTR